ncbi:MAG: 3-phosphoshikimate 1-carboxyvinyltransferase [Candidatus Melainabacteria bacterium]|nr:3-phosphoshikimate 1-carboxyvinyltransferase [Candidatus Melainabacteria bacterium]
MPPLSGSLTVPGDKSISHRALIFSAFSQGTSEVFNCSPAHDVISTAECLNRLGLSVKKQKSDGPQSQNTNFLIESGGIKSLRSPTELLDAGNSGTTIRLMSGLVAGCPFTTKFDGDESLRKRTMKRVFQPLAEMGAQVTATEDAYAPFAITGGALKGKEFVLNVASAQVEACILLAGLQAEGKTSVTAPRTVRDHTRRMFEYIGVSFVSGDKKLSVEALTKPIPAYKLTVPSDISSAAFFMVAAACIPDSDLTLLSVGINPGRTLIIDVLRDMGASIDVVNEQELCGEPVADIRVRYNGRLTGVNVPEEHIATGIDEIPVLAIAGAICDGEFKVSGAEELRHKESDRISALCNNLKAAGVDVDEKSDGFIIRGQKTICGGSSWKTALDHRLAMTAIVASYVFEKPLEIDDPDCMSVSYPEFRNDFEKVMSE